MNNDTLYHQSLFYIKKLNLPLNFEIETIAIKGARGLSEGYNQGMCMSDAKYKIYLHQDVWILEENFARNLIALFNCDIDLGLVGMIGTKSLPANGVWWESDQKEGKVVDSHTGTFELLDFQSFTDSFTIVDAVDGLLMATQYDIGFRADLFDGWHFYDISQCYEFKRRGYKIGIPFQRDPWCIHQCGIVDTTNFEEYRKVFINEYRKDSSV